MIENTRSINFVSRAVLLLGCLYVLAPLYFVLTASSISYEEFTRTGGILPTQLGSWEAFWGNLELAFTTTNIPRQIFNSAVVGLLIGVGGVSFAICTAYAIVFFGGAVRRLVYGMVIMVLFVPGDALVVPLYQVASNIFLPINALANLFGFWEALFGYELELRLNILNTYGGMTLPLMIEAGGTLVFIQYFRTIPPTMVNAARMDGAGPTLFFKDMLLPQAIKTAAGLFIIMFVGGWNQFFWPLVSTTDENIQPAVVGLRTLQYTDTGDIDPNIPLIMVCALMITILPLIITALNHRVIARGVKL